MLKKKVLCWSE